MTNRGEIIKDLPGIDLLPVLVEGGVKELQRLDDDVLGLPDLGKPVLGLADLGELILGLVDLGELVLTLPDLVEHTLGLPDLVVLVLAPGDVDDGLLAVVVFAGLDLVMTIIKDIDCRQ